MIKEILTFLDNDIKNNPNNVRVLDESILKRAQDLIKNVKVNLDSPLEEDDEDDLS